MLIWGRTIGCTALPASQQADDAMVKRVLLATYRISTETHRWKVSERAANTANPDQWLWQYPPNFNQWLDSTGKPDREAMLMELVQAKLPSWLETQIRNLDCPNYEELMETIIRHLGNPKNQADRNAKKEPYSVARNPSHWEKTKPHRPGSNLGSGDCTLPLSRSLQEVECFKCGERGHYQRDCHVKVKTEQAKTVSPTTTLPEWIKTVKINGTEVKALLDTACTKTSMHPRCVAQTDCLGWKISFQTASDKEI